MGLTVQKKFFERREQVFEDLAQTGHWPTTFVSGASPELPLHWHDLDVSGYVIEGTTYLVDEAGQHHHDCSDDGDQREHRDQLLGFHLFSK